MIFMQYLIWIHLIQLNPLNKIIKTYFDQQIPDVSGDEADTYKCFATNEYGKAIVTATLNVIEGPYQT